MAKAKTYHDGAAETRRSFLRKLRRWRTGKTIENLNADQTLAVLISWVLRCQERYEKRKGGLGRKRKKVR